MFGGPHKTGRGGGGGRAGGVGGSGSKRGAISLRTPNRPTSGGGGGGGRLSLGGSASRGRNASAAGASAAVEETFSLVPGDGHLSFAATLRLPPGLVEEIKRVESEGGVAKMKFDSNPNNALGNVIDVGGKQFRFTWSREMGDLCDIYEERQNGEDGNGLLAESGCAWRKLNVQRTLDESTKNHLKMRTKEAEHKSKARKTMVLEPGNPSMKSQIKALAAADASPWKNFKQKKEQPYKKRRFDSTQGPTLPLASPSATVNIGKYRGIIKSSTPIRGPTEENIAKPESDIRGKATTGVLETFSRRDNENAEPADLQSMLINLLKDKPGGMSLKALEIAVGDGVPGSARKIEPILKKIAILQAPGRYFLNSEVDMESLKRSSTSGSSPEANGHKPSVPEENHDYTASQSNLSSAEKPSGGIIQQEATFSSIFGEEFDEKLGSPHHSPPTGDKNSEGRVGGGSGSESDSDSDSDSSDTGSESRSRSRSLAESGSRSSSDSESDSSSNKKELSDVDVDIVGDDDKKARAPDPNVSSSPFPCTSSDERPLQNGRMYDRGYEDAETEKEMNIDDDDLDIDVGTAMDLIPNTDAKPVEDFRPISPNLDEYGKHWDPNTLKDKVNTFSEALGHDNTDRCHKPMGRSKKGPSGTQAEEVSHHLRRLEGESPAQSPVSRYEESIFYGSPRRVSSDTRSEDFHNAQLDCKEDNANPVLPRGYGDPVHFDRTSVVEPQQSGRRLSSSFGSPDPDIGDRSGHQNHGKNNQQKSGHLQESMIKQKERGFRDTRDENGKSHKKPKRKSKESGSGNKYVGLPSSHQMKPNEQLKNFHLDPYISSSPPDSSRVDVDRFHHGTGRSSLLHREQSEPELGEFREPSSEGPEGLEKQYDEKGLSKFAEAEAEAEAGSSGARLTANVSKGKPTGRPGLDPARHSTPDNVVLPSRSSDIRVNVIVPNNGFSLEGYGDTHKKSRINRPVQDFKQERTSNPKRGSKSYRSNVLPKGVDYSRGTSSMEEVHVNHKRSESSSDESSSFSKYEKEEPDLKGPIKDFIQYTDYVQEYSEKYSTYRSIDRILGNYRREFYNMGKDLDSAKDRDSAKYQSILRQLRESYCRCGEKHKRLKKIFVVLHQELKHLRQRINDFAASYSLD